MTARARPTPGDDELRPLVRELLRELLPSLARADPVADPGQMRAEQPPGRPEGDVEVVTLRSDADLDRFVRRLLTLFENPEKRADLQTGRLRFTLGAAGAPSAARATRRVDQGAATERLVNEAAAEGATLVLGRRAVLTPLARDRAKALGVAVERES